MKDELQILRAAVLWGDGVLGMRELRPGESLRLGDGKYLPKPLGSSAPDVPLSAKGSGWELDPSGTTGGRIQLASHWQTPASLALSNPKYRLAVGDCGLLQYGDFALFFQMLPPVRPMDRTSQWESRKVLAFALSVLVVVGGLLLVHAITLGDEAEVPLALQSSAEFRQLLHVRAEINPRPAPAGGLAMREARGWSEAPGEDVEQALRGLRPVTESVGSLRNVELLTPDEAFRDEGVAGLEVPGGQGLGLLQVRSALRSHASELIGCFRSASDSAVGTVTMTFTIIKRGTLGNLTMRPEPTDLQAPRCVERGLRRIRFPSSGKPTVIRWAPPKIAPPGTVSARPK
jgi:hypothetical protein